MIKRLLFYLLSELYGLITSCRNWLYDHKYFDSKHVGQPKTIIIGNLAVGGTGKSPFVAYLVQHWPFKERLGILSRGYGRKTKGFRLVESSSKASEVGDEPLAYKQLMQEITVAVCEKRVVGVEKLQHDIDTLFLDDAFQHRAIQGDVNLLCTTYDKPFFTDKLMPLGRLRESIAGVQRAQAIIVNRCPATLAEAKQTAFESFGLPVFYTRVTYGNPIGPDTSAIKKWHLVAGIADVRLKARALLAHLREVHARIVAACVHQLCLIGGQAMRAPLMTAYRQEALRCAVLLAAKGPMKVAALRLACDAPKAAQILQQDVYGWFERVERGVYAITPKGREGLERARERLPALILSDVMMPEMDGYEATARIRAQPQHAQLPVIAMTAHALAEIRERCLREGMQDYLTKPIKHRAAYGYCTDVMEHIPTDDVAAVIENIMASAEKVFFLISS